MAGENDEAGPAVDVTDGPGRPEIVASRCGAFCGACTRFHGRPGAAAARFLAVVEGSGAAKALTEERYRAYPPALGEHYTEAKRHLAVLRSWLGCWGCLGGGGPRDCEIRRCCEDRGFTICFECPDFSPVLGTCGKFEAGWFEACNVEMAALKANYASYRELGMEGWKSRETKRMDLGWRSTRTAIRKHLDTVVAEIRTTEADIQSRLASLLPKEPPHE